MQEINQNTKDDLHRAHSNLRVLDAEKDRLGHELDLKAEEVLHLTQELKAKNREIEALNLNAAEMEAALE